MYTSYDTECVQEIFLNPYVMEDMKARWEDTPSMLDLIFTYNDMEIENIRYDAPLERTDHTVLEFEYVVGEEISKNWEETEPQDTSMWLCTVQKILWRYRLGKEILLSEHGTMLQKVLRNLKGGCQRMGTNKWKKRRHQSKVSYGSTGDIRKLKRNEMSYEEDTWDIKDIRSFWKVYKNIKSRSK